MNDMSNEQSAAAGPTSQPPIEYMSHNRTTFAINAGKGTGACDTGPSGGYPRAAGGGRLKITETALGHLFYLAQAEVEDAAKLQPGEWLVHTNDVQAVLNDLHKRILEHPHAD